MKETGADTRTALLQALGLHVVLFAMMFAGLQWTRSNVAEAAQGEVIEADLIDPTALGAAMRSAFARTSRAVIATALPLITAVREAKVPTAYLNRRVSPVVTVIESNGTPSSSATICASIVWCPCPCEVSPVDTTTLPSVSTRMWPPSYGPTPVPST